jgi:hypothetical protein
MLTPNFVRRGQIMDSSKVLKVIKRDRLGINTKFVLELSLRGNANT